MIRIKAKDILTQQNVFLWTNKNINEKDYILYNPKTLEENENKDKDKDENKHDDKAENKEETEEKSEKTKKEEIKEEKKQEHDLYLAQVISMMPVLNKFYKQHNKNTNVNEEVEEILKGKDLEKYHSLAEMEEDLFKETLKDIKKHKLEMHLLDVKYNYDGTKLGFLYTAENRVDFRELVKDLATKYKTRIEMRQINEKEELIRDNGNGKCGRRLCCASFLKDSNGANIKMVKNQSLSFTPSKINGACGRLMCCLRYEDDVYKEKLKKLPEIGSMYETEEGTGEVVNVNALKESIRLKLVDESGEYYFKTVEFFKEEIDNKED